MTLYHGSNVPIGQIDLSLCKPYKDFGRGFYLTDIKEQAEDMAFRRKRMTGIGEPVVTCFHFDESLLHDNTLRVKIFPKVSVEWARFVLDNRDIHHQGFSHPYDIVVGPVANDTVAFQLRRYLMGVISLEDLVKELEYKDINRQFFFGTELAISKLQRI